MRSVYLRTTVHRTARLIFRGGGLAAGFHGGGFAVVPRVLAIAVLPIAARRALAVVASAASSTPEVFLNRSASLAQSHSEYHQHTTQFQQNHPDAEQNAKCQSIPANPA
jgi:hypothetical protein